MKILILIVMISIFMVSCSTESAYHVESSVPNLIMPKNNLAFKEIEDYQNYKIIATHFRKDKNELRYILANATAYRAYRNGQKLPEGSKIVKIGWDIKEMENFAVAIEANEVLRVEYMLKDSKKFSENPGNWGYARFVKENGEYKSWTETASCISCHNIAQNNDFLFTKYQELK